MSYRVSFELANDDVSMFLRNVAPKLGTVRLYYLEDPTPGTTVNTTHKTESALMPESESAPIIKVKRKARRKPMKTRGSRVNDAILDAIGNGQAKLRDMKLALERAGRSAGSLSTGLAFLQREGIVEKCGVGLYQRTHRAELPQDEPPEEPSELSEQPATDALTAL